MIRVRRVILSGALVPFVLVGCIPETPEEKPFEVEAPGKDVNSTDGESIAEDAVGAIAVPKPGDFPGFTRIDFEFGAENSVNAGIEIVPMLDQPGYRLRGSYNLRGSIIPKHDSPGIWELTATFTFPSSGFTVDEPYVNVLDNLMLTAEGTSMEAGSGDIVIITIPVHSPGKDEQVAQAQTELAVSQTFEAPEKAQFTAVLTAF